MLSGVVATDSRAELMGPAAATLSRARMPCAGMPCTPAAVGLVAK